MTKSPKRRMTRFTSLVLALGAVLATVGLQPASAALTERECMAFVTGDSTRMLSVCTRGWIDATGSQTRAVVEMHTYVWSPGYPGGWADSVSRSITLNIAFRYNDIFDPVDHWGNDSTNDTNCRINGPSGRIGCSVPNTARVAFYSAVWNRRASYNNNEVWSVSWRDDRGQAHYADGWDTVTHPDKLPLSIGWGVS